MEYGAIIWDPYNKNDINKLENLQRRGARFITKDYKSREEGSMTKMLRNLASTTVTNQETTPATEILLQSGWGADTSGSSSWIYKPPKT